MLTFEERTERCARVIFVEGFVTDEKGREYAFEAHRHPGKYFCGYIAPYLTANLVGNESAWLFSLTDLEKQWRKLGQYFNGTFEPVRLTGDWETYQKANGA